MNSLIDSSSEHHYISIRKKKGFTLTELVMIMGVLGILSGIAMTSLLQSRITANQSSAISSLDAINQAQTLYSAIYGNNFARTFAILAPSAGGGTTGSCNNAALLPFIPWGQAPSAIKEGYSFTMINGRGVQGAAVSGCATNGITGYVINAQPLTVNQTGNLYYCTDESAGIFQSTTAAIGNVDQATCEAGFPVGQ